MFKCVMYLGIYDKKLEEDILSKLLEWKISRKNM